MLELRPKWCATDDLAHGLLSLGDWLDADGRGISESTGDKWTPGMGLRLRRTFTPELSQREIRQRLGLSPDASVGIAARWFCVETASAGSHLGGPLPLDLDQPAELVMVIPGDLGGSVEVETCLVVRMNDEATDPSGVPNGGLIWSDSWSTASADRRVLLEGSELRIPVRSVSFASYFDDGSRALWAIEAEPESHEDMLSATVTVLVNVDEAPQISVGDEFELDVASLSSAAVAGIQVDLVRVLCAALIDDIEEDISWSDLSEGSIGQFLALRLTGAFGSVQLGLASFREDQATFARLLWGWFAPVNWGVS